jgi:CheY-like chemotaxis protein
MDNAPKVVLIVDDDPTFLTAVGEYLQDVGYTVHVVRSGEQALVKLQHQKVDAVFLDILMPNKDGIETLLAIKKFKAAPPVYMMSGGGRSQLYDFLEAAVALGADGMLKKPFSPSAIIQIMESLKTAEEPVPG